MDAKTLIFEASLFDQWEHPSRRFSVKSVPEFLGPCRARPGLREILWSRNGLNSLDSVYICLSTSMPMEIDGDIEQENSGEWFPKCRGGAGSLPHPWLPLGELRAAATTRGHVRPGKCGIWAQNEISAPVNGDVTYNVTTIVLGWGWCGLIVVTIDARENIWKHPETSLELPISHGWPSSAFLNTLNWQFSQIHLLSWLVSPFESDEQRTWGLPFLLDPQQWRSTVEKQQRNTHFGPRGYLSSNSSYEMNTPQPILESHLLGDSEFQGRLDSPSV